MVLAGLLEERILVGVARVLNKKPGEIQKDSKLIEDLEVDSLDALELIFKLEEEFDIEIPEGSLPFVTVQDVIKYVQEKTNGG